MPTTAVAVATGATWHERLMVLAATEAIASALWLWPASIHIVSWPSSGPERVALLLPAWELLASLAAGAVLALVLAWSGRTVAAARAARPLLLLWILWLPYLPWFPDRLPLLLALAGPLRVAVITVAFVGATLHWWSPSKVAAGACTLLGRRSVFGVSLALYLALGLWSVTTTGLDGDQPHYLVITESLQHDRDLQIENNHRSGGYKSFFPGDLRPDFLARGKNGQIYSIHAPGLPALLLPAYAAAGYLGAVAFVCLIAAFTARAVFDLAERLAGRSAAVVTWLAACLTVPFVPHSWSIFPEMPGALLVAWSACWLAEPGERSPRLWVLRGMALGILPWLHTKFVVLQALLTAALMLRAAGVTFVRATERWTTPVGDDRNHVIDAVTSSGMRERIGRAAALVLPGAISGLLWLSFFYVVYGAANPEAPYGAYPAAFVLASNIPHGLIGLAFDPKFGLLFYTPAYLVAVAGAWYMLRERGTRWFVLVLGAVTIAFSASTARLYMFWGGTGAPARFLVPIIPCLAPMMAVAFTRVRGAVARGLIGTAIISSVGFTLVAAAWPQARLFFSDAHGRARVLEVFAAGTPLADAVPTLTDPDWTQQLRGFIPWLLVPVLSVAAALAAGRGARRGVGRVAAASVGTAALAASALTAASSTSSAPAVRDAIATQSALDLLWDFDGARHRTLDYLALARATPERMKAVRTVALMGSAQPDTYTTNAVDIPPGTYDVVVSFSADDVGPAEIRVVQSRFGDSIAKLTGMLSNPSTLRVDLPVADRLSVRVTGGASSAVSQVRIVPRSVSRPAERPQFRVRRYDPLPGTAPAFVIYTDDEVYPESGAFWTRGTADTQVYVAAGSARRVRLTLSTGPRDGEIRLTTRDGTRRIVSRADRVQDVTIEVPKGGGLLPIGIGSSVEFRPGEVNPASSDMRLLGCRVNLMLE